MFNPFRRQTPPQPHPRWERFKAGVKRLVQFVLTAALVVLLFAAIFYAWFLWVTESGWR